MGNVFISYGDQKFHKSLKRIKKQAKDVGIFDKIITFTPKDLPLYIKCSPLFSSMKGGGYWLWKPYIINYTLGKCHEGDVLYYVDAGCTLNPNSKEWDVFQELLTDHQAIVFQYRNNHNYGWDQYCKIPENNKPALRYWIKPLTKDYFTRYLSGEDFLDFNKILGGIIIIKRTQATPIFLSEWLNISLYHPELLCDPFGEDLNRLPEDFNVHRHDQAIITPLIFHYKNVDDIFVLPETAESNKENAAIIASRRVIWSWNTLDRIRFHIMKLIKIIVSNH